MGGRSIHHVLGFISACLLLDGVILPQKHEDGPNPERAELSRLRVANATLALL